jgi:hypothetical protein
MGITTGGIAWDGQELLHLGIIEVGDQRLYAAYALRQPAAGVGDRIRARADGAHPILLVPSSQIDGSELAKVMVDSALPNRSQVIRGAISACGLANVVPAIHTAPDGARLVVDTQFKKVWVDGVEIGGLVPESHPFRLIELLARSSTPVSTEDISAQLSPARLDGDTSARQAKLSAKQTIAKAMTAAGRTLDDDPFPTAGTGFYRCALLAHVR